MFSRRSSVSWQPTQEASLATGQWHSWWSFDINVHEPISLRGSGFLCSCVNRNVSQVTRPQKQCADRNTGGVNTDRMTLQASQSLVIDSRVWNNFALCGCRQCDKQATTEGGGHQNVWPVSFFMSSHLLWQTSPPGGDDRNSQIKITINLNSEFFWFHDSGS